VLGLTSANPRVLCGSSDDRNVTPSRCGNVDLAVLSILGNVEVTNRVAGRPGDTATCTRRLCDAADVRARRRHPRIRSRPSCFTAPTWGLRPIRASDGINVFSMSLASTAPKGRSEVRLIRAANVGSGSQAHRATSRRAVRSGAFPRGARSAPAMLVRDRQQGDYGFLTEGVLAFESRRIRGRLRPAAGRGSAMPSSIPSAGVHRSGETVHITYLPYAIPWLRRRTVPLTWCQRPDGLEYRRTALSDLGNGAYSSSCPSP